MRVMGIDPGLKGAIALYSDGVLTTLEIPTLNSKSRPGAREVDWNNLVIQWNQFPKPDHVFLEQVAAMPKQGVAAMFKMGTVFGGLRGIIAEKHLPLTLVTPRIWKKEYGLGPSKDASVLKAAQLFPYNAAEFRGPKGGLKDGVAEAALIARYGFFILKGK